MRLTADLLLRADNYLNACMERELNLRGYKIPAVENISVLQDQYDVIDFSDNDIKKLDNFPIMKRLNTLLLNHNNISRVSPTVGEFLTGLTALVLTNNKISSLSEIDHIASIKTLETLSLLGNLAATKPNYRWYVIHKIPSIKYLDFMKVKQTEREEAHHFFQSAAGKAFSAAVEQEGKVIAEAGKGGTGAFGAAGANKPLVLTEEQKAQVKAAIERAATKEEIDIIERQLKLGNLSFLLANTDSTQMNGDSNGADTLKIDSNGQINTSLGKKENETDDTVNKKKPAYSYESTMEID